MENKKTSIFIISGLILVAALSRLLPHAPNFTPVGATALFGAAYFTEKYWALIIPFIALWVSDLILNNIVYAEYYEGFVWFTSGFAWIIGAFALITLFGMGFLKKIKPMNLLASSLVASALFFLITNFGVWMSGVMYPKTGAGLMATYAAGVPFFWNTLAGDLFYVSVLFGVYEFVKSYRSKMELAN
jgi:hypothetical protein